MSSGTDTRRAWRSLVLLSAVILVLTACGQNTAPLDPGEPGGPGDPDPGAAACRVVIDSDITIPTLLTNGPEACDYLVTDTINVTSRLEIEPGTVVEFEQDSRLLVTDTGSIWAVGTPDQRIELRGRLNVTGFWYGICFGTNRHSRLEHVNLLNAGKVWTSTSTVCRAGLSGVSGNGEPVDIVNTLVAGAQTTGVDATRFNIGEFGGNVFAANLEFGLRIDPGQLYKLDVTSDYLGSSVEAPNTRAYVWVGGTISDTGYRHTWPRLHVPYYVGADASWYSKNLIITDETAVRILPGTEFHFQPESGISVWDYSALEVMGTAEEPVIFTSVYATPGAWDGIYMSNGELIMEHAEVHWAGDGSLWPAAIKFGGTDYVAPSSLSNVLIQGSSSCGLRVSEYVEPYLTLTDITFENNVQDECT